MIASTLEYMLEHHSSTLERAELSMLRDAHLHASHSQADPNSNPNPELGPNPNPRTP